MLNIIKQTLKVKDKQEYRLEYGLPSPWKDDWTRDNHWRAPTTPTARNICTCAVFPTSSFNFGLPTYFGSHYCYGRAVICCFLWKSFLCASCWHHVFVLLAQFALVQPWVRGRGAGSFPEQRLVIEPKKNIQNYNNVFVGSAWCNHISMLMIKRSKRGDK